MTSPREARRAPHAPEREPRREAGRAPDPPFRLLVCDMDGTLNETGHEIEFYAERVREAVPAERREAYWAEWQIAREGRHEIVRVGALFRDPDAGSEIPIGDAWWIAPCLGRLHGATWDDVEEAFARAREYMASAEYHVEPVPGVARLLAALRRRGIRTCLATNTEADTGPAFLAGLGLADLFDERIFGADKPEGLTRILERLIAQHSLTPAEIACVGDNWVNDVEPAVRMGCQGMFIDRHGVMEGRSLPGVTVFPDARSWVEWLAGTLQE